MIILLKSGVLVALTQERVRQVMSKQQWTQMGTTISAYQGTTLNSPDFPWGYHAKHELFKVE